MDKILITGVSGFIGSNLANYLLQNKKFFIYGIDNFSHSTMSNLYPLLKNERFEFIEHDLLDDISPICDFVFHFAGNGDLSDYNINKYNFILNKIEITKNIISYCKKNGSKLIYPSEYINKSEDNFELVSYFDCINLIEKLLLELIEKNELNCKIIRLSSIYGENMLKNDERFVPKAINKALNNEDFVLESDESAYFTYIKDVLINLEKVMFNYYNKPILDIINNNLYLKSDIIRFIIKYTKSQSKFELKSEIQKHPNFKPKESVSLNCNTSILDGLSNTINNFKLLYYS